MTDAIAPILGPDDLRAMLRLMLVGRRFTEHALRWYRDGRLPQGLHPSIGQEAVGVGACYGLHPGDWVLPSLRTAEAFWTRGVTVVEQLHAMFGNARSVSRGKETSHHAGYPSRGILAGSGIVGGSIPVAVGAALALKMRRTGNVVVCFFGDGAANRGDFHEGLNLAAVLRAPVVLVCENNAYAQMVPARDAMAIEDVAVRAAGYGMPGEVVDGQDVRAVHASAQRAAARARAGEGPTLLECKTYRFKPHYPIFAEDRAPEEIAAWTARDPIRVLAGDLQAQGLLSLDDLERFEREIDQELAAGLAAAEAAPPPDAAEVFANLYAEPAGEMGL